MDNDIKYKNQSNTCIHVIPHYVSYYHSVKCEFKTDFSKPLYWSWRYWQLCEFSYLNPFFILHVMHEEII